MNAGLTFIVILVLVGFVSLAVLVRRRGLHAPYLTAHDKSFVHVRLHEIEERLKKGGPTQLRQAVIDADTLVDYTMKQLKVPGTTMGERLKAAQPKFHFTDYQGLWDAHKLRNQVVHEMDREVLSFEAKRTVEKFRTALRDLGAV